MDTRKSNKVDNATERGYTDPMKELFKFWVDSKQLAKLKALAAQGRNQDPPITVSLLMRRAIDAFLKQQ